MKQEDTKQKILEKSLELFAKHGYSSVTVEDIAAAVGVKAPSLYNHYRSKHAIFDVIVRNTVAKYAEYAEKISMHLNEPLRDTSMYAQITADDLVRMVKKFFTCSLVDKEMCDFRKMMTIEQFGDSELSELYSKCFVELFTGYYAGVFRILISIGKIRDLDPYTLAMSFASPILMLIGVCDRQPERFEECIEKLDSHVRVFYETYTLNIK